jgi:hypothetical protein
MYRQSVVTFSEAIADLEQALAWLESMRISTATKRHATYLRTLKMIDKNGGLGETCEPPTCLWNRS